MWAVLSSIMDPQPLTKVNDQGGWDISACEAMWECWAGFWSECCFSFWLLPLFFPCCFLDVWSPFWSFCLLAWGFHFGLSPLHFTFKSFWICFDPPFFCFQACLVRIPSWISVNSKSAIAVTCKYIWVMCSNWSMVLPPWQPSNNQMPWQSLRCPVPDCGFRLCRWWPCESLQRSVRGWLHQKLWWVCPMHLLQCLCQSPSARPVVRVAIECSLPPEDCGWSKCIALSGFLRPELWWSVMAWLGWPHHLWWWSILLCFEKSGHLLFPGQVVQSIHDGNQVCELRWHVWGLLWCKMSVQHSHVLLEARGLRT